MADLEFRRIFADLQKTEQELEMAEGCQLSLERCFHKLLQLRRQMDSYVELWLCFEEKINVLQEKFNFSLPDELPEAILKAFLKIEPAAATEYTDRPQAETTGLPVDENICIRSFRKGLGFLELAMMDEAISEFKQVAAMKPDLFLARLCLGVAYAEKGEADEAMRELRLVQALTDDRQTHAIIHNTLGNLYAGSERYQLARPEFEQAVALAPDFLAAHFNLAATYYNLQEYEKSLLTFLTIKDNFQRDWEIYFYLGKAYKKAGNEEEALVNLLKAAYLAPNQYCVFLELGLLYEQLGETRKALDYYYRAHRLYLEEEQREYGRLEDNSNQSRKTKTGNEVNPEH
ncbi:MAG: Lipopolysaccharide assembly protein B [Syntrophomonadaceae bacterium]|nr:Lipopolysaccharide assembly protein B [Bacillota bacterium]